MSKVIVIGGGAAGMMAAIAAAQKGHKVILLEKNEKLGKKLFITGKGRCNVTNAADMDVLFQNICTNEKFLYSAFYGFDNTGSPPAPADRIPVYLSLIHISEPTRH